MDEEQIRPLLLISGLESIAPSNGWRWYFVADHEVAVRCYSRHANVPSALASKFGGASGAAYHLAGKAVGTPRRSLAPCRTAVPQQHGAVEIWVRS